MDITPSHLQPEKTGPRIIDAYKKLSSQKSSTDVFNILLLGYARSPFLDFESTHRSVVDLDADEIQLMLKLYNSIFITFGLFPRLHIVTDISEVVYTMGDHEGTRIS